ncbi:MAG: type II toxin-antitoxin system VapC family toxin [Candidatus Nanopelagicales bacterium]|nr:type II toxin-antitoxin system VapC family toxin [Candidatus Nanopelagicales bacterium]
MIILDTNVVSELMRPAGDPRVLSWMRETSDGNLATTSITVAEIEYGLARLPDGTRADALRTAASGLWKSFATTILPFDVAAARDYGSLMAARGRAGRPTSALDVQIAAIARVHKAKVATRNVADFRGMGLKLIDPWAHTR